MAPEIRRGDQILMEVITFKLRHPKPGDVVAFTTKGIPLAVGQQILLKRIAATPGDKIEIKEGNLFVNRQQMRLKNSEGIIHYDPPSSAGVNEMVIFGECTLTTNQYFTLGDNSTNSFDSRFYGGVPQENLLGRICFRFWPPSRVGFVE